LIGLIMSKGSLKEFILNASLLSSIIPSSGPPGNEILHTVVVEMAIYATYPIFRNKNLFVVFSISMMLYLINILFFNYFYVSNIWIQRNYFSLVLYWIIGAIGADYFKNCKNDRYFGYKILVCSIIYFISSKMFKYKGIHYIWAILVSFLISAILIYILRIENKKKYKLKIYNVLGESAYSIYAWHWLIIAFVRDRYPIDSNVYLLLLFTILVFSMISYHLIEMPFNRLRFKFAESLKNIYLNIRKK
jgi:peptidoglycan/LPS O-acetylase OafA/YrhL